MHVAVDQAGEKRPSAAIDDLGVCDRQVGAADEADSAGVHQDRAMLQRVHTVEYADVAHHESCALPRGGHRRRREAGEDDDGRR